MVNHPTVRERSTSSANSSWRPCPSTSITTGAPAVPRNSAQAKANAINRISWIPAWNAAGTSPSSMRLVSTSSCAARLPALT
ncbi:hypothetical protein AWC20_20215 [Mycobacterium parmense]|nr:hypothetical protein AWC20_20215 [Mycobacterium parmense]